MALLVWRELVANEHSGWKSCVRDTTVRSTLCLFPILMDNGFLPIVAKNNVCFSVYGSFVPVGHVSCTWHGHKSTVRDQRHSAAALISPPNDSMPPLRYHGLLRNR